MKHAQPRQRDHGPDPVRVVLHTTATALTVTGIGRLQVWMNVVADPSMLGVFLLTCRGCGAVIPVACTACAEDARISEARCWQKPLKCQLIREIVHHARRCCSRWLSGQSQIEIIPLDRVRDGTGSLLTNFFAVPVPLWATATMHILRAPVGEGS